AAPARQRCLSAVRGGMASCETAGMQRFGVHPAGVPSHAIYVSQFRFTSPLLSDPDRAIARAYRALKDDGQGIQRSVYVVRRDGTIAFAQRGAPAVDDIVAAPSRPRPDFRGKSTEARR